MFIVYLYGRWEYHAEKGTLLGLVHDEDEFNEVVAVYSKTLDNLEIQRDYFGKGSMHYELGGTVDLWVVAEPIDFLIKK